MTENSTMKYMIRITGASALAGCGVCLLINFVLIALHHKVYIYENSTPVLITEIVMTSCIILLGIYLTIDTIRRKEISPVTSKQPEGRHNMAKSVKFRDRAEALEYAKRKQNEGFFDAQVVKRADGSYSVLLKPSKAAKEVSVRASGPVISEQAVEREEKKQLGYNGSTDKGKNKANGQKTTTTGKWGTAAVKVIPVSSPSMKRNYYLFRKKKKKEATLSIPTPIPTRAGIKKLRRGAIGFVNYSARIKYAAPRAKIAQYDNPKKKGTPRIAAVPHIKG